MNSKINKKLFIFFIIIGLIHFLSSLIVGFTAQTAGIEFYFIVGFGPFLTLPAVLYLKINKRLSAKILIIGSLISCCGYAYSFIKLILKDFSIKYFDFLYFIRFPLIWNIPMIIIGLYLLLLKDEQRGINEEKIHRK